MGLPFTYIDYTSPVPAPPPSLNGGLYTGEPFREGAGWANVYVRPDADAYAQNLLQNSQTPPPPGAQIIPTTVRPGNNAVRDFTQSPSPFNFTCMTSATAGATPSAAS